MAKPSLQVKNISSLLLATGASIASGLASRRFFDPHPAGWRTPAVVFVLCLGSQLALVFVESKEEEELSLDRKRRMGCSAAQHGNRKRIADEMKISLHARDLEYYKKLKALRR